MAHNHINATPVAKPAATNSGTLQSTTLNALMNGMPWMQGTNPQHGWRGDGKRGVLPKSAHVSWEKSSNTITNVNPGPPDDDSNPTDGDSITATTHTQTADARHIQVRLQSSKPVIADAGASRNFILIKTTTTLPESPNAPPPQVQTLGTITLKIPKNGTLSTTATPSSPSLAPYIKNQDNMAYIELRPTEFTLNQKISLSLLPVDIDIVHPATGELDEAKQHDPTKGGYVAVRRDYETPVTKLVLRQGVGVEGMKYKVKFNGTDKFKLWKDEARTQAVVSAQTEFDPAQETTLYFKGLEKSASVGAEAITLQAVINGTATDAETVYASVVEAEFDVWLNVFIPPQWTDFPATHPIHIDYITNPLDPYPIPTPFYRRKIAAGDDRSFNDEFFDDPASAVDDIIGGTGSRAHMQVTVIPFKDLDLDGIKDDS
jgi:hypothetical protein